MIVGTDGCDPSPARRGVGRGISASGQSPEEKALTRRCAPTSPASEVTATPRRDRPINWHSYPILARSHRMSEKPLTPIEIGLTAAIVAIEIMSR